MPTTTTVRPRLKRYLWPMLGLMGTWVVLVAGMATTASTAPMTDEETGYMARAIAWGLCAIAALTALAFAGHWAINGVRFGGATTAAGPVAPTIVGPEILDQADQATWSLELRGVGIAPEINHQSSVWRLIQEKRDNFTSVFSQDPQDYPDSSQGRGTSASIRTGAAFEYAATDSVAYWPIPAFVAEPPQREPSAELRAASLISNGRNKGSLGVTLFLWQQDANTNHAQHLIEQLFNFMAEHAEVPQAMIASRDGDVARNMYRPAGSPALPDGLYVPKVLDNTAVLMVSRSDRVDHHLRPRAPEYRENNQDTKTDMGKLWAFYWKQSDLAYDEYDADTRARRVIAPFYPGTMTSAYWQAALPELWKTIDNRGPGQFTPTPWLPVRWTRHQVAEFDRAPKLGHLHRPVKVPLRDEQGKPLKPALQAKALKAGWAQVLATLPPGHSPVRVFYDSTDNQDSIIALNTALHELNADGHGLDPGNVDEGYDIGRRLGDTGLGSALVQIGLAAIASYKDGGVSAVMYAGEDGSVSLQMVRPPSAEEKNHNAPYGEEDPFMYRAR
ncbi:hypothetical protein DBR34_08420 [Stenotrophomonas sp. HMWF003]|nr:hypothetical protein DBR34_08420 [Stenotrophomonas sp. HMWF003]